MNYEPGNWFQAVWWTAGALCVIGVLVASGLGLGPSGALVVGGALTAVGALCFGWFLTPRLEPEWPLDGKDGWLIAAFIFGTAGLPILVVGAVLALL